MPDGPRLDGPRPRHLDEGLREFGRLIGWAKAARERDRIFGALCGAKPTPKEELLPYLRRAEALALQLVASMQPPPAPVIYRCSDGGYYGRSADGDIVGYEVVDARSVPVADPPASEPVTCHRDLPERESLCGCVECVEMRAELAGVPPARGRRDPRPL